MSDFAVLDSLSPVFVVVDQMLSGLSLAPLWRIAVFAAIGSAVSMLLFKKMSNQVELAAVKQELKQLQRGLMRSSNSGDLRAALKQNLKLSGRQLWLSFWPAMLASIPILFLMAFCSNQFGVEAFERGERVYVTPVFLLDSPADFEWRGVNAQWDARKKAWTFYDPNAGQTATLVTDGRPQMRWPTAVPTRVLHKKQWWNVLIANPAGYLEESAAIDSVAFNTPTQVIINWGPGYMRGWLFAFLVFLVLFSVGFKLLWKIH